MKHESVKESIFQDKIKLSSGIIQKEFDIIQSYTNIVRRIRQSELEIERIGEDHDYQVAWQMMAGMYWFLKYKYAKKLEGIDKEKFHKMESIMINYDSENEILKYPDFKLVFDTIIHTMSINNFDDVSVREEEDDDF